MNYIPKKIHLIWVGGNPYSPIVEQCIASWKKYCPDYEIKVWNETNFDVNSNTFAKEAYQAKKWAFVADYLRLYALYTEGGIYIDSDCELLRGLDSLIENEHAVTGYSTRKWIPTGLMAAEKGNPWIKDLLDYYDDRHFILPDGKYNMKVNNVIITEISAKKHGFKAGDMYIEYGKVRLYPTIYFHPPILNPVDWKKADLSTVKKNYAYSEEKTYCIHYGTATWVSNRESFYYKFKHLVRRVLPRPILDIVVDIYYKFHKWNDVK